MRWRTGLSRMKELGCYQRDSMSSSVMSFIGKSTIFNPIKERKSYLCCCRQEWPSDARVAMLRLLAYGAKEDDIVLILHMDRKDHSVMNYAQQFDRLPVKEQESLALLVS